MKKVTALASALLALPICALAQQNPPAGPPTLSAPSRGGA